MKKPVENYGQVRSEIAKLIMASPLASKMNQFYVNELNDIVVDPATHSSYTFIRVEFHAAGSSSDLEVNCGDSFQSITNTCSDEEGNKWRSAQITCKTNYPCHGSEPVSVVLARLAFYQQVVQLAAEIEATYNNTTVYRMYYSAAQIAEDKAKAEAQEQARIARQVVELNRAGLRVNKNRFCVATPEHYGKINVGSYNVDVNGSSYTLDVTQDGEDLKNFMITRVR